MSSPEFELVVACCRWPPSAGRAEAVRRASEEIDWERFLRVVARHRVEGLVQDALRGADAVPAAVADQLAAASVKIARGNLAFAAVSVRLAFALDEAGIRFLFVKGVTLGMLAYGSLGVKQGWDIDVAVDPEDYAAACAVLTAAGYVCAEPGPGRSPAALASYAGRRKHTLWTDAGGVPVELHAGLTDNPLLLPGLSVRSPRQDVQIAPGMRLPTLARDALFAYLCVHGAAHAWSRLKWIADVAASIAREDAQEIARLHRASQDLGAGRSSGQALLLIAQLFDRRLPPALEASLQRDPVTAALVRTALASMTRGGDDVELDALVLGTVPIHLSHFFLARGWRYKWSEARRKFGGGAIEGVGDWLTRRRRTAGKR